MDMAFSFIHRGNEIYGVYRFILRNLWALYKYMYE